MALNLFGFDSAWSAQNAGAICALRFDMSETTWIAPEIAGFARATDRIRDLHQQGDVTLVAIDQPTIVRNQTGMRPCERIAASLMSRSGGGIQPAYRDKKELFGDDAPIWRFRNALSGRDDVEVAASAGAGCFIMEVYPALSLLALDPAFAAPKGGPRYNPARPTFRLAAWCAVCDAAEREARRLGLPDVAAACRGFDRAAKPAKSAQDRLDAILCLLIARRWMVERDGCVMIGDLDDGFIVAAVNDEIEARLRASADRLGLPADSIRR